MDQEDLREMLLGSLYTLIVGLFFMLFFIANNFQTFKCVFVNIPYIYECRDLD